MAYQMTAMAVTLNDLAGHSSVAGLFKCNPSNICAAFYTISTDSVLARFLCISRYSCFISVAQDLCSKSEFEDLVLHTVGFAHCVYRFSEVGGWSHCEPWTGTTFVSRSMCRWLQVGSHWWPRTARSALCWCTCVQCWWVMFVCVQSSLLQLKLRYV